MIAAIERHLLGAARMLVVLDVALLQRLPRSWRARLIECAFRLHRRLLGGRFPNDHARTEICYGSLLLRTRTAKSLPRWLKVEIEQVRRDVDPSLYQDDFPPPSRLQYWLPARHEAGAAYRDLARLLPVRPNQFIIAASRAAAESILRDPAFGEGCARSGNPVVVITDCDRPPLRSAARGQRMGGGTHDGATTIYLNFAHWSLSSHERAVVVIRMLIQYAPTEVYLTNASLPMQLLAMFGDSLLPETNVVCAIQEPPMDTSDGHPGFDSWFPHIDKHVTRYILQDRLAYTYFAGKLRVDPRRLRLSTALPSDAPDIELIGRGNRIGASNSSDSIARSTANARHAAR